MVVNTDEDFMMETFDYNSVCFYLSLSVYFDGGLFFINNNNVYTG